MYRCSQIIILLHIKDAQPWKVSASYQQTLYVSSKMINSEIVIRGSGQARVCRNKTHDHRWVSDMPHRVYFSLGRD